MVTAVASSAMAAMFPPPLPGLPRKKAAPLATTARYDPATAPATQIGGAAILKPPLGVGFTGMMAFGGHRLALPPGTWQVLTMGRADQPIPMQITVLARFQDRPMGSGADPGNVTGLIEAEAPAALSDAGGPVGMPEQCLRKDAVASAIAQPPAPSSVQVHECWTLTLVSTGGSSVRGSKDPMMQSAIGRLDAIHATLPAQLAALWYFRSDAQGLLMSTVLVPHSAVKSGRAREALTAWATASAARFHAGYDNVDAHQPADPPG